MKTNYLFPNHLKRIGWILLIPSSVLFLLISFNLVDFDFLSGKWFVIWSQQLFEGDVIFGLSETNFAHQLFGILFILGALFAAFSKEKHENEFIAQSRLESLFWATLFNCAITIFGLLFFIGFAIWYVLIVNIYLSLIFFFIRYYYVRYKSNKSLSVEVLPE